VSRRSPATAGARTRFVPTAASTAVWRVRAAPDQDLVHPDIGRRVVTGEGDGGGMSLASQRARKEHGVQKEGEDGDGGRASMEEDEGGAAVWRPSRGHAHGRRRRPSR
jgi:hypothetical protein